MLKKIFSMETLNQVGKYFLGEMEQNKLSVIQKAPQQIRVSFPKGKPFVDETNKTPPDHTVEKAAPIEPVGQGDSSESSGFSLQEAIIWSEILGRPMCKRRNDRNRLR
jgi:hypothetical protein